VGLDRVGVTLESGQSASLPAPSSRCGAHASFNARYWP